MAHFAAKALHVVVKSPANKLTLRLRESAALALMLSGNAEAASKLCSESVQIFPSDDRHLLVMQVHQTLIRAKTTQSSTADLLKEVQQLNERLTAALPLISEQELVALQVELCDILSLEDKAAADKFLREQHTRHATNGAKTSSLQKLDKYWRYKR